MLLTHTQHFYFELINCGDNEVQEYQPSKPLLLPNVSWIHQVFGLGKLETVLKASIDGLPSRTTLQKIFNEDPVAVRSLDKFIEVLSKTQHELKEQATHELSKMKFEEHGSMEVGLQCSLFVSIRDVFIYLGGYLLVILEHESCVLAEISEKAPSVSTHLDLLLDTPVYNRISLSHSTNRAKDVSIEDMTVLRFRVLLDILSALEVNMKQHFITESTSILSLSNLISAIKENDVGQTDDSFGLSEMYWRVLRNHFQIPSWNLLAELMTRFHERGGDLDTQKKNLRMYRKNKQRVTFGRLEAILNALFEQNVLLSVDVKKGVGQFLVLFVQVRLLEVFWKEHATTERIKNELTRAVADYPKYSGYHEIFFRELALKRH